MNLKAIWTWVRKLPIAKYLKPLWKGLLKEVVTDECAKFKEFLKKEVSVNGPGAVDLSVDWVARKLAKAIVALPLPAALEDKLKKILADYQDDLRLMLRSAVANQGPGAIDAALDSAQGILMQRIDAL